MRATVLFPVHLGYLGASYRPVLSVMIVLSRKRLLLCLADLRRRLCITDTCMIDAIDATSLLSCPLSTAWGCQSNILSLENSLNHLLVSNNLMVHGFFEETDQRGTQSRPLRFSKLSKPYEEGQIPTIRKWQSYRHFGGKDVSHQDKNRIQENR